VSTARLSCSTSVKSDCSIRKERRKMANKALFKSLVGKFVPAADARNEERAPAYALTPKQALAQYAATGCLSATFYVGAQEQLAKVLELCERVEPDRKSVV